MIKLGATTRKPTAAKKPNSQKQKRHNLYNFQNSIPFLQKRISYLLAK